MGLVSIDNNSIIKVWWTDLFNLSTSLQQGDPINPNKVIDNVIDAVVGEYDWMMLKLWVDGTNKTPIWHWSDGVTMVLTLNYVCNYAPQYIPTYFAHNWIILGPASTR